ncbi:MAG: TetR family transcriptional regulator [Proteobacteria bacterium]|nr:TetR family transcriptional regulator [Pseudomonadota bacterium]NIS71928.1 TetR family transcriptional regulator [Pseudomonadota bacterium]
MLEIHTKPGKSAREKILSSAICLFSQKGYDGVAVREIVHLAGVTKPVLYYYFKNKEGLYLTLLEEVLNKYRGVLETASDAEGTTVDQLVRLIELQLDFCHENQTLIRLCYGALCNPPSDLPPYDFDRFSQANFAALKEIVNRGVERGELNGKHTEGLAVALLAIVNIYAMDQVYGQGKISKETAKRSVEILYHGIKQVDEETG